MHFFYRASRASVNSSPTFELPTELWQLICSFLPQKEVCRLRSLNRVFLSTALRFHYGTLLVETFAPKAISLLNVLTSRYISENVHTLHLKNYIRTPSTSVDPIPASHFIKKEKSRFFPASLAMRVLRYAVDLGLKRLDNVQHLRLEFGPAASVAVNTMVFQNLRHSLVQLDLHFWQLKYIDNSWLNDSVYCPNVRSLELSLNDMNLIYYTCDQCIDQTILGIRSLVPSTIDSLKLAARFECSSSRRSTSLNFFNKLKKLHCTGYFVGSIFDMNALVQTNIETLVDIDMNHVVGVNYAELNWGEEVHSLSFDERDFFENRHLCFPRLARCNQLRILKISGIINDPYPTNVVKERYEEFHQSLLLALSRSAHTLIYLEIPYLALTFQRVWRLVCTFPNLDRLAFVGTPDEEDPETYRVLLKCHYYAVPRSITLGIFFDNLKTCLCEIRKNMAERSSIDLWEEHSEAIEDAFAACSSRRIPE